MIKFLSLNDINNRFRHEIDARIKTILDKGWYLQGEENELFSKNFAAFCGTKHAVGVANGLDAINLILSLKIQQSIEGRAGSSLNTRSVIVRSFSQRLQRSIRQ